MSADTVSADTVSASAPFFSVLMPVYETPERLLREAIESVLAQSFEDWELLAVDDASPSTHVAAVLREYSYSDPRIKVIYRPANGGIVASSNDALQAATGEWIAMMDHDDLLAPEALLECHRGIEEAPDADFVYTDEDWVQVDGTHNDPFLKPDWSPERFRAQMYTNHLSLFRASLLKSLGGWREGFDGSQDYDLVLRLSERARRIVHLPRVLYHWRIRPGQVSASANPAVYSAARRAIEEHLERTGIKGWVEQTNPLGIYRVHREVTGQPKVSIVIPTRGSSGEVRARDRVFVTEAAKSIVERSTYPNFEAVVVADTATPQVVIEQLKDILGSRLRLVAYDCPFNFARKINLGVATATGEYLVLLNDDVEVITPEWLEVMLGLAQQPDVGLVGTTLYFDDRTFQHAGHVYVGRGAIGHIGYGAKAGDPGPVSGLQVERECSGVTAACAMVRRQVFLDVGGMSLQFPMNYNDVDLSFKVRQAGLRIVWTPFAELYHFESKTRKPGVGLGEVELVSRRWGRLLENGDPYWRDVHDWAHAPLSAALVGSAESDSVGVIEDTFESAS